MTGLSVFGLLIEIVISKYSRLLFYGLGTVCYKCVYLIQGIIMPKEKAKRRWPDKNTEEYNEKRNQNNVAVK